jgi:hypothetical protein
VRIAAFYPEVFLGDVGTIQIRRWRRNADIRVGGVTTILGANIKAANIILFLDVGSLTSGKQKESENAADPEN